MSHIILSRARSIPAVRVFVSAAQHKPLDVLTMIEIVPGNEPDATNFRPR